MKTSIILSLSLTVAAGILDTRQLGGGARVAGVEKLTPRIRTGAQRTLTKFGREWSVLRIFSFVNLPQLILSMERRRYALKSTPLFTAF
jgi:hypothetical protein